MATPPYTRNSTTSVDANGRFRRSGLEGVLEIAGLPAPSVVRCAKIATLDAARAEPLGRLSLDTLSAVRERAGAILRVP